MRSNAQSRVLRVCGLPFGEKGLPGVFGILGAWRFGNPPQPHVEVGRKQFLGYMPPFGTRRSWFLEVQGQAGS